MILIAIQKKAVFDTMILFSHQYVIVSSSFK